MSIKNNRGITLIALVITIIVLLILAGVTINMVLGEDGIIGQAQDAKKAQKKAEEEQTIELATGEAGTSEHLGVMTEEEVEEIFDNEDMFDDDNTTDIPKYNNSVREIKVFGEGANAKYLPIPKGMAWAYGTIDEGAVVVDKYGNEYVWVPVADTTKMFSKTGTGDDTVYTGKLYDWDNWSGTGTPSEMDQSTNKEPYSDNITEYNYMAKSVETYGGFYVGRYETSWTGSRVASVGNVEVMNGNTPLDELDTDYDYSGDDDGLGASWYTFYTKQKELYPNNSSNTTGVVSGMIYGCQWDAIMDWMSDVTNPKGVNSEFYILDSTEMGNYNRSPIETGSNSAYSVKNIYDLAGNYCEWTQEAYDHFFRVRRGGNYYGLGGSNLPASDRDFDDPVAHYVYSSRLQLYIK